MKKQIVALLVTSVLLPAEAVAEGRYATVMSVDKVEYAIDKSNPPQLSVVATGKVSSSGWTDGALAPRIYIEPPADGIMDFDFIARAPEGIVLWVILPITASVSGPIEPWMKGVRVHAATNEVEVKFGEKQAPVASLSNGGEAVPWPFPWNAAKSQ